MSETSKAPASTTRSLGLGHHAVVAVLVIVACVLLLRRMDLARVLETLRAANGRLVAGAVVLSVVLNTTARVFRRRTLFAALPRAGAGAGFLELASLIFVGQTANKFLPARAGDAITTVQLHRRHGYPVASLVAAQLLEKVLEVLGMCLLALACAIFFPPASISRTPFFVFGAAGGAALILLVIGTRRWRGVTASALGAGGSAPDARSDPAPASAPERGRRGVRDRALRFLGRLGEATRLLGAPHVWPPALLWSLVSDFIDVAMIALCLASVGLHVEVGVWLLVYLAVNLAIAVPLTPGQVGVLEAGAVLALASAGVGQSEALAFALIYHAVHIVPPALLALPGWSRLEWSAAREGL
ncbi:MAG: lysylphosphatidylglycerol synthase transmembrane domain-containing protein [bacterium]